MITTTKQSHKYQEDDEHYISLGDANQESGYGHTTDTYGNKDTGTDAVGQPPCRHLAEAIDQIEGRDDKTSAGIIKGKFIADKGQKRYGQRRHQVVRKVCQDKDRYQSSKERTKVGFFNDSYLHRVLYALCYL